MSVRTIQLERNGWILLQSVSPKQAGVWIADKRDSISDPEFRAIYLEYDQAFDWSPDDPRLEEIADRSARWLLNRRTFDSDGRAVLDPAIVQLVTTSMGASSPAWDQLTEIGKRKT